MNHSLQSRSCAAWLVVLLGLFMIGCSADAGKNPLHGGACQKDRQYKGYCLPAADGGSANVGDGGGASVDAGEPCKEGDFCYEPGMGYDVATRTDGVCRAGSKHCVDGRFESCLGQVIPSDELCDGLDNDCDKKTDEEVQSEACPIDANAKGRCRAGIQTCEMGRSVCRRNVAIAEACNGEDDDCDGKIDEDSNVQCYPSGTAGCVKQADGTYKCKGLCHQGTQTCQAGKLMACANKVTPKPEVCTGSAPTDVATDENCDGVTDEGCPACTVNAKQTCYSYDTATLVAGSECHTGMRTCMLVNAVPSTDWGPCDNEQGPVDETCKNPNQDDDCNGTKDDVLHLHDPCSDSTQLGVCRNGTKECQTAVTPTCETPTRSTEICDGFDNDCDGKIDQTFMLQTDEANCGMCNHACKQTEQCCGGKCIDPNADDQNCNGCGMTCGMGVSCCGAACVDTNTDEQHCGDCATTCTNTQTCCGGGCVDVQSDPKNCGSCGHVCSGVKSTCCGGACVDTTSDAKNCKTCGNVCLTVPGLIGSCNGSACKL